MAGNFPNRVKVYLVGGAVRNRLLGLPIYDYDHVVIGATPELMMALGYKPAGSDFPVFIDPKNKFRYALARREKKVGKGHRGFVVQYDDSVTLEEDLYRRDLTINAIAQDKEGVYRDPHEGFADVENRILRHISPAFVEDPLRVLRLLRFHAVLQQRGFLIAEETWRLAQAMADSGQLQELSLERVWMEVEKALHSHSPTVFFQGLYDLQSFSIFAGAREPLFSNFLDMQASLFAVAQRCDDAAIRFGAWLRYNDELRKIILDNLPLSKKYRFWIELFALYADKLQCWYRCDALVRWQLFHACGSLSGRGVLCEFCDALGMPAIFKNKLCKLHGKMRSVRADVFVEKGIRGAALGAEIRNAQVEILAISP